MSPTLTPETDVDELVGEIDAETLRTSEQRRSDLQRWARGIAGQALSLGLTTEPGETARVNYAEEPPQITVPGWEIPQPVTNLDRPAYDALMQQTLTLHEVGHLLYTDEDAARTVSETVDTEYRDSFQRFWNALEDGAIEAQLRRDFAVAEELGVMNANYLGQQTGELGMLDAVLAGCLDLGVYDTGTIRRLADPDDEAVTFSEEADRETFVKRVFEELVETVADARTEPDPIDRVERIREGWEAIQPHVESAADPSGDLVTVDDAHPVAADGDAGATAQMDPATEDAVESRVEEVLDSIDGFDADDVGELLSEETPTDADTDNDGTTGTTGDTLSPEARPDPTPAEANDDGHPDAENAGTDREGADTDTDADDVDPGDDEPNTHNGPETEVDTADADTEADDPHSPGPRDTDAGTPSDDDASDDQNGTSSRTDDTADGDASTDEWNDESQPAKDVGGTETDSAGQAEAPNDGDSEAAIAPPEDAETESAPTDSDESQSEEADDTGAESADSGGPKLDSSEADAERLNETTGDESEASGADGVESNADNSAAREGDRDGSDISGPKPDTTAREAPDSVETEPNTEEDRTADRSASEALGGEEPSRGVGSADPAADSDGTSKDAGNAGEIELPGDSEAAPETGQSTEDGRREADDATNPAAEEIEEDVWTGDIDSDPTVESDLEAEYRSMAERQREQQEATANRTAAELAELQETIEELDDVRVRDLRIVDGPDEGRYRSGETSTIRRESRRLSNILERQLQQEQRSEYRRGRRRGEIDSRGAHRLLFHDFGVFQQEISPEEKDYDAVFVLDRSGSMSTDIAGAERATATLLMALEAVDVDTCLIDMYGNEPRVAKPFGSPPEDNLQAVLTGDCDGSTPLSPCLELAREHLRRRDSNPFVVVVTDGRPDDEDRYEEAIMRTNFPVLGVYLDFTVPGPHEVPGRVRESGRLFDQRRIITSQDELLLGLQRLCQGVMF